MVMAVVGGGGSGSRRGSEVMGHGRRARMHWLGSESPVGVPMPHPWEPCSAASRASEIRSGVGLTDDVS